jgi:hypothetical protein
MSMQQLRARLGKLEAEQRERPDPAYKAEVAKACQRYRELMRKDWRQLTPAELEERDKLGLRYIHHHSFIMACERALREQEEREEKDRQWTAEWRARQAAKGGRETKG